MDLTSFSKFTFQLRSAMLFAIYLPVLILTSLNSHAESLDSIPLDSITDLSLYYALGGKTATSPPASDYSRLAHFDASSSLFGSICGQFDPIADVQDILSSKLNETLAALNSIPNAVVGTLPGYILCRAQPGMCQLLQHYVVRAEDNWNTAVQSCEADVSNVVSSGSPFRDWIQVSKVQNWEQQAQLGSSASQAKESVDSSDGCVTWVGGKTAGCTDHEPIWPTKDSTLAGWCLIQSKSGNCSNTSIRSTESNNSTLYETWPDAESASDWVVDVVGDHKIHVGSKPAAIAGTGLLPKIESETLDIRSRLRALVYSSEIPHDKDLAELSTDQVQVSAKIIDAMKDLPDRDYLIDRLANEIALLHVVNKAFLGRRLLLSGMMEPNIKAAGVASEPILQTIDLLEREIERSVYEMQLSRRLISDTASQILSAHQQLMNPKPPTRQLPISHLP